MSAKRDTRFKPGVSGNPAGRPVGSGLAGKLRKAIAENAVDIVHTLVDAAKAGDVQAARVLLDRVIPPLRAESAPVRVPGLGDADSLRGRAEALVRAAADGKVTPDTAALLVNAIGTLARVIETDDLERRIAALEQRHETD